MPFDLKAGIVRILAADGTTTTGTGFVLSEKGIIATCSHVIQAEKLQVRGYPKPERVEVIFRANGQRGAARLLSHAWRSAEAEDVAMLQLEGPLPPEVVPLSISICQGAAGHDFKTFGFPDQSSEEGIYGEGRLLDQTTILGIAVMQVKSSEITPGFSGAPVFDMQTRRVVGMVTSIAAPDKFGRLTETAFITPAETLISIYPELVPSDLRPYMGLSPFTENDAEFFFGRRRLVEGLEEALRSRPRFLLVMGPSGSGKSSVVQAGLIPRLRKGSVPGSDRWGIIVARPADRPFDSLERAGLLGAFAGLADATLGWLNRSQGQEKMLIVLDQFEEFLVTCPVDLRRKFWSGIEALLNSDIEITLLAVMRDDFYSRFADDAPAEVLEWTQRGFFQVGSNLEHEELREIIQEPARRVGLQLEEGLTEVIINDVLESSPKGEARAGRSTVLPLLEFSLFQLWERRDHGLLTHQAYQAIGKVTGSLTAWADQVCRSLEKEGLGAVARRILTDLVNLGDEKQRLPDSRRQRRLADFLHDENDENERETVQKVVQRLADSRLVTTSLDKGEETVQIIHDSLIREWALLQRWLKKDRAFLAWERELEKDAREWQQTSPSDLSGRDEGRLLRGRRLEEAERWQKERERDLGEADQEFINASLGLREREREKEERAKAEKERTRRRIIQGIAIFSIFSLALAGVAMLQKQQADEKTEEALARSLAAQSEQRRDIPGFLTESILLAIESLRHKSTVEGKIALHNSLSLLPRSLVKLDSSSKLLSVAFSSDGSKIASLNGDGNAYVWATRTGHQLHMIALNFSWFYPEMAFSPDGTKLALTDEFGDVGIWNLSMGNQSHIQLPSDCVDRIHFLKYSRDGKKLITACGQTAIISNTDNGRPIHFLKHNASIIDLELSDNSAMLATISEDMVVSIWDIESGRRLKKLYPDSQAIKLVFDHNSTRLAAACEDKAIRIWDANTGKMLLLLQNNEIIYDMDFSPNGEDFAIGLEDKAVILNINSDQKIELPASKSRVIDVLFSPDGRKLAMKSSFDNSTSIWDVKSGNELMRFENIFFTEAGSAFTPDGRGFAVVGTDRIWDTRNSKDLPEIDGYVRNMAYSPDGRIIATAGESNNTQIWDTRTLNRLQSLHNSADANDLKFSPDSRKLAVACSNGEVEVWDLEAGKKILNLHHNSSVNSISFSPDGLRLATASDDGFAAVWDVIAGTKLLDLPVNNDADAITFNNDGTELAAATYGPAYVWNAQTGEILQEFEQFTEKYVTASVAFNSDGTELVMSNGDGTARIWNIKTGKEARVLSHDAAVIFVAFNPASATLATGSMDGFVRIWNMKTGELLQEIEHTGTVRSMDLDFSPDGNNIVRTSDGIMQTFCIKNDILIKDACSRITENMTGSGWSRFMEPQDCLTCPREGRFNKSGIWPWEQENCQPCIESINASRV